MENVTCPAVRITVTSRVLARYRPKSYWVKIVLKLSSVPGAGGRSGDCDRMAGKGLNAAKTDIRYGRMKTRAMISSSR